MLRAVSSLNEQVYPNGENNDEAEDCLLNGRGDVQHDQPALDDLHDQRTHNRLADRTPSSEKAGTADHDGGYGDHLETYSGYRLSGAKPGGEYKTCKATQKPADGVDAKLNKIHVNARCSCCILIAADRVDVPSETCSIQHKRRDARDSKQDDDRYRYRTDLFLSKDAIPRLKLVNRIYMIPYDKSAVGIHGTKGNNEGRQRAPGD